MKHIFLYFIISLLIISTGYADELPLPEGWRIPKQHEQVEKWAPGGVAPYLHVVADFNGDGIKDEAQILINENGIGLFAFMGQKNGSYSVTKLVDMEGPTWIKAMGITIAEPGTYLTACGKGYVECQPDEPEVITLQYPAIDFFKTESANSYFYWNRDTGGFKRVWISD